MTNEMRVLRVLTNQKPAYLMTRRDTLVWLPSFSLSLSPMLPNQTEDIVVNERI